MKKKYKKKPGLINKTGYTPGYDTEKNPVNYIPSESITMANTPYPVKATPLDQNGNPIGDSVVMQPGGEYKFKGADYVKEIPFFQNAGKFKKQDGANLNTPESWEKSIRNIEHQIGNPNQWSIDSYRQLQKQINEYKFWRENTPEGKAVYDSHNETNEYVVPLPKHLKMYKPLNMLEEVTPNYQNGGKGLVKEKGDGTQTTYSYPLRDKLYPGEDEYFKAHPEVGGMAAEDNQVIINPYSKLTSQQKEGIRMNETARLAMRNGYKRPTFDLTPEQQEFFSTIQDGKPYSEDLQDIRETIIGRILSGDDSAGNVTPEQKKYAEELQRVLKFQGGGTYTVSGNQPLIIPSQGSYPFDYNKNLPTNEAGMPYVTDTDGKKILLSSYRKVPTKDEFGNNLPMKQIRENQKVWNDQKEAYSPGQDDFNAWKNNAENTQQGFYNKREYDKIVKKFNKLPDVEQEGKCDINFNPTECGISKQHAKEDKKAFGKMQEQGGLFKIKQNNMNSNIMPNFGNGGEKSKWISNKIGILMDEGYPQKQAIAIAYSMYEQKHKNGGYQLPMYQKGDKYNNGNFAGSLTYGQGPNLPTPSTTYDPNKKVDPNAPTPEAIAAYEKQQKAQDQGISIAGLGEYGTTSDAINNAKSGMTNPELMPSKEQLKSNRQQNTATNNYDENGNAINTSELARNNAENSPGGNPLYQFANLEGDMGTDDALFHLGKNVESGNALGIAASATSALLKGGKDFLAGMGSQRRQNYMMKSYYDNQRDNMTGAGREQALKMGGYYKDGGEDEDTPGGMMGRAKMIPEIGAVATRQEVEASRYDTNSARDTWEAKTGMPWSEAKRLGYTDGSAQDNIKLLSELKDSRFNSKNLRKTPMANSTPQLSKNKPVAKAPAKTYTKEELDTTWSNYKTYDPFGEMLNKATQPKKPAAKAPAKASAKTPQLQKKAPAKTYTKEELNTAWGNYETYDPFGEMINPDQRNLQSGVITDKGQNMTHVIENGKVVKSFPVLTGQNSEGNKNTYSVAELETNKKGRTTPTGTYLMQPAANIYGKRGFRLNPIAAFGEDAPQATNVALHTLYGTNPNKGEEGYDPEEGRRRTIAINSSNPKDRYKSYGCINGRCEDTEDLADRFPKSDTLISIDSRKSKDRALLSRFGVKKYGGYYQEGGMQPGMEEVMEGQMSNPQEEGMEQQGGGQEQQIMQEVAQALQQGADPQQIVQQLVQMGIPEQQAVQMVQMVMQQLQGSQEQPQQQGTPQLRKGGEMIRRADGSYSRRGMWDNIRDNNGSGKAPTKEMLEQEAMIRANRKEMGGYMYANGGINNPGFNALPDYVQNKILSNMYQEGGEMMDEQMEGENEGAEGETANLEQIEFQVEQALKQGADPQQILQQLVQMGIPQEQAIQMIQEILQEIQGGETELEAPEMKNGGSYLNTLKGKTIKDYTYNPKTNSYTVSYE